MAFTYQQIQSYLKAFKIIIRDRKYNQMTEQEAKRRIVMKIEAGKARPDELYITVA